LTSTTLRAVLLRQMIRQLGFARIFDLNNVKGGTVAATITYLASAISF